MYNQQHCRSLNIVQCSPAVQPAVVLWWWAKIFQKIKKVSKIHFLGGRTVASVVKKHISEMSEEHYSPYSYTVLTAPLFST